MSRSDLIFTRARADFRRQRAFWMRQAREYAERGNLASARWCLDGARIAHRNLMYVSKEDA